MVAASPNWIARYACAMASAPAEDRIPIFPLSSVVLFPGVNCPLYIFEPRYRQMTADAIASAGRIGMVVARPHASLDMAGNPELFAIGCEGRIARSELRPDGTYSMLLRGVQRFRIRDEPPLEAPRLYRVANIEPLVEEELLGELADERALVLSLMARLTPDRADQLRTEHFANLDDTTFVNAFCQSIDFPTLEKQQLLEANGVSARVEALTALLKFRIAAASGVEEPQRVH